MWAFVALDSNDASLKFNRFSWIYSHHKSESEAIKALHGQENSKLLPDFDDIEKAVKEKNTFIAVIALRTLKSISIPEAQEEVHKIWRRIFEAN